MSNELLPCPFCGERPRLSLDTRSDRDEWYIWCSCGMVTHFFYSDTDAIAAWNRRVPAQGVPVEVWHTLHAALEEYRDDAQRCFCPCSECVAERDEANSALTWLDSQRSQGQEE